MLAEFLVGMLHMRMRRHAEVGRRGGWIRRLLQSTCLVATLTACGHAAYRPIPLPRFAVDHRVGPGISPESMLVEPGNGATPLVHAIDHAQRYVFLEMYILSDSRVVRALERAASQGVAVYVLLDPHPYGLPHSQPLAVIQRLHAAGIRVRWSRPGFVYTHAKVLIVDDRLAVISTANFSNSAFTHNRDFLIFDGHTPDVRAISAVFRADWDRLSTRIDDSNLLIAPDNARSKLSDLLGEARHRVDVYGEEIADTGMEHLLATLHSRGISVRVLLPSVTTPGARWLAARGVTVRTIPSPYIHAKAMIVDGREAFVGSENMSTTSLDRNRELGILVRGDYVLTLERVFSADWSNHG